MPFLGKSPKAGNYILLDSITTSATATYNLTRNSTAYFPASARNLIVSLNGITQAPDTAYSVSGSTITFSSALTSSDVIDYILVLGEVLTLNTPADNTVGTNQMSYPLGNFSSTGIDDNASSTAITISSAGASTFSGDVILSESSPRLDFFDTDITDSNFRVAQAGATTYVRSRGGTSDYGDVRFQRNNDGSTHLSVFRTTAGGDVIFYDDDGSTEGMRWDASTSRLGLSDGTPASMFQIGNGTTEDSNAYITFGKRVASTETNLPFIGQDDPDGGGHNDLGIGVRSSNGTINFYTGNVAAFTASNRRMTIAANGNVGIGTTDPLTKLDVRSDYIIAGTGASTTGTKILSGYYNTDGDEAVTIGTSRSSAALVLGYGCYPSSTTADAFLSSADNVAWDRGAVSISDKFVFRNAGSTTTTVGSSVTLTERFRIAENGYVGINTSDPQVYLDLSDATGSSLPTYKGHLRLHVGSTSGHGGLEFHGSSYQSGYGHRINCIDPGGGTPLTFSYRNNSATWTEIMRIDTTGKVGIGDDDPSRILSVRGPSGTTSILEVIAQATTPVNNAVFRVSSDIGGTDTTRFRVELDGDVKNTNNSYGALSDISMKSNIVDANSQLADIMSIRVRKYTLNESGETHIGVIAQELEEVGLSGLVDDTEEGLKAVKYSILYMKAIKALQEQQVMIEDLQTRLAAVESN